MLDRHDQVAALGLLMQWLSEADEVGLQAGPLSFDRLLTRWVESVAESPSTTDKESKAAADPWPLATTIDTSASPGAVVQSVVRVLGLDEFASDTPAPSTATTGQRET